MFAEILGAVVDHFRHRTIGRGVAIGTRAQESLQLRRAPAPKSVAGIATQIGGVPAVQFRSREKSRAVLVERLLLETDAARRVARTAVPQTLRQIGAAIPFGAPARLVLIGRAVEENHIPQF